MEGKAKEAFQLWLECKSEHMIIYMEPRNTEIEFNDLNKVCQNAMILDWLDHEGIRIEVRVLDNWYFSGIDTPDNWYSEYMDTRQEAIQKAIDKAIEIFNKI